MGETHKNEQQQNVRSKQISLLFLPSLTWRYYSDQNIRSISWISWGSVDPWAV